LTNSTAVSSSGLWPLVLDGGFAVSVLVTAARPGGRTASTLLTPPMYLNV